MGKKKTQPSKQENQKTLIKLSNIIPVLTQCTVSCTGKTMFNIFWATTSMKDF